MQGRGWARSRVVGVVALLTITISFHAGCSQALSFDPKKLESSSQLWSGYHPNINVLATSFEDSTPTNITALVGDSAFLPCTVFHLGDRSVTWMRKRDLHILTAGIYTYSADERFMVLHPENSNDWTLHIKFATLRDSGVYECQVNSDPKISRTVYLNVIENQLDDPGPYVVTVTDTHSPDYKFDYDKRQRMYKKRKRTKVPVVMIEGLQERHIQRGSILGITCVVHHAPQEAPENILWFHGALSIDYDSPRGGVSIQTEKALTKTISKLMLSAVDQSDTGQYSCSPTALEPAEITVHVQDGAPWPEFAPEAGVGERRAPRLVCVPPSALRGQIQQPVKQGLGFSKAPRSAASWSFLLTLAILIQLHTNEWSLFD